MNCPVLQLTSVGKRFENNDVLRNVDFTLRVGSVHALLGENGAGKSTLVKIIAGIHQRSSGQILVKGNAVNFLNARAAADHGIAMIHQELMYIPEMSIVENMYLGHEIRKGFFNILSKEEMQTRAQASLKKLGLSFDLKTKMKDISISQRQLIEIAKAIYRDSDILIMDEPTSTLEDKEIRNLFKIIKDLNARGVSVVYISHKMDEIFEISDDFTVLRDGERVAGGDIAQTDRNKVISMMVGRDFKENVAQERKASGPVVLSVNALTRKGAFENISFELRAGELLGFSGLMGAGRTEVVRCVYGLDAYDSGEIYVNDEKMMAHNPREALGKKISLVSDDRKNIGLVLGLSIRENISLQNFSLISRFGFISEERENKLVGQSIQEMDVRASSSEQNVGSLSGGNQQKVVLGKVLMRNPKILILDEPTRGIDIGAKAEIYRLINELLIQGVAILLVSSELPELLLLSDRILVFKSGKIVGALTRQEASEERVMKYAFGHK